MPAESRRAEKVEQRAATRTEVLVDQLRQGFPRGRRFGDVPVGCDGQVVDDHVERAGPAEPFHGVRVVPFQGVEPIGVLGPEEAPAGGIEIDDMESGDAAEGAEGGDDAAAAEAEEGDIADGLRAKAGGGEDVEDAVRGAGVGEDFAEDGSVLGQSPAASSTA